MLIHTLPLHGSLQLSPGPSRYQNGLPASSHQKAEQQREIQQSRPIKSSKLRSSPRLSWARSGAISARSHLTFSRKPAQSTPLYGFPSTFGPSYLLDIALSKSLFRVLLCSCTTPSSVISAYLTVHRPTKIFSTLLYQIFRTIKGLHGYSTNAIWVLRSVRPAALFLAHRPWTLSTVCTTSSPYRLMPESARVSHSRTSKENAKTLKGYDLICSKTAYYFVVFVKFWFSL